MRRFLDAYPESILAAMECDATGRWLFIGEGGKLAIVDLEGVDSATTVDPMHETMPVSRVHRVDIGAWGIRPAALLLDPDANLDEDDEPGDGNTSNELEDLLYVAGGINGLWILEAGTNRDLPGDNDIFRVDDRLTGPLSNQTSRHFCNQLAVVRVGGTAGIPETGTQYLAATFARRGDNRLRFYKLSRLRNLANGSPTADGTGAEIAADYEVTLPGRPGFSPAGSITSSYVTGIAVDYEGAVEDPETARVYLSMGTHGAVRGTIHPNAAGELGWVQVEWGPYMGDGSYAALNEEPPPFQGLYHNLDYRIMSPCVEFGEIVRSEPPVYTDVAVENVPPSGGQDGRHYLYCTLDHLNWVRYDLDHPTVVWSPTLPINHHEGEPVNIKGQAEWRSDLMYAPLSPPETYGPDDWVVRPEDFPPLDAGVSTDKQDATFAARCELVTAPDGRTLFVVTSSAFPFLNNHDIVMPAPMYNYHWNQLGGMDLGTVGHLRAVGTLATGTIMSTIVYDTASLGSTHMMNGLGWVEAGGKSLLVPRDQSTTNDPIHGTANIKFFHNVWVTDPTSPPVDPFPDGPQETCLTFYNVQNPPSGLGDPVFVRDNASPDARGRYTNGIQHNILDPRILVTGHNDGGLHMDGALWARPLSVPPGAPHDVAMAPTGPDPLPGTSTDDDRRMDAGLIAPEGNQWVPNAGYGTVPLPAQFIGPPPILNIAEFDAHLTVGEAIAPDPTPMDPMRTKSGWSLTQHLVRTSGTLQAETLLHWRRVFRSSPKDRWERTGREGTYITATTTPDEFTAWALAQDPNKPVDYLFFGRGGTSGQPVIVDRSQMMDWLEMDHLGTSDPSVLLIDWPNTGQVIRQFILNGHPEWDAIPSGNVQSEAARWWSVQPTVGGFSFAPSIHHGTSRCWAPILLDYPEGTGGSIQREWVLAVPCFTLSNPYDGGDAPKVAGAALDNAFKGWMDAFPGDAEQQDLLANYSHGLVQFWRLTDQPEEARDPVTHPGTGIVIDPPGTSDLPYIVLPHAGTCAWRLDSAVITTPNPPSPPVVEAFLFVADFGGHLFVYDITDLPVSGRGNLGAPALTYTSPPGYVDGQPLNVRALVVDQIDNLNILVYVGVASYGIEVIHMFRTSLNAPWNLAVKERIETPGTVHDLAIRPAAPGQPKLLLVADGPAGLRIFGEEQ